VLGVASMTFEEYISQCMDALQREANFLKTEGGIRYKLTDGKLLSRHNYGYSYLFQLTTELSLPDGAPVRVHASGKTASGEVVSIEGFEIFLGLNADLGETVPEAELSSEAWFLLEELQKRLQEVLEAKEKRLPRRIVTGKAPNRVQNPSESVLHEIIRRSRMNPATYIWGPPGTGKTHTLSRTTVYNMQKGASVLVMSHSNVAVDEIMLRVARLLEDKQTWIPGQVVRFGVPKLKEVWEHDNLLAMKLVESKFPFVIAIKDSLLEQIAACKEAIKRKPHDTETGDYLASLEAKLKEWRTQIREMEEAFVRSAQVVGVTLSKATVNKAIRERQFDLVIVDEASMAYVPHIVYAVSLGKRAVICGDFRQLPPIVQSDDELVKKRLAVDIFHVAGITKAVDQDTTHPNLVMLREQRRMHPDISRFSNHHFYSGRLIDHPNVQNRQQIAMREPFPAAAVALFDTTVCNPLALREISTGSRFNLLSALLSAQLMVHARHNGIVDIGYITPYNAQARLVSVLIKELIPNDGDTDESHPILCATVHKFQGSERDAIFYDPVDSYPQKAPGILHRNKNAGRLVNVAITRARGKFVQIANRRFLKERLPVGNPSSRLVDYTGKWKTVSSWKEIRELLTSCRSEGMVWYFEDEIPAIFQQFPEVRGEIIVFLPEGMHLHPALWQTLRNLKDGIEMTIVSRSMLPLAPPHWRHLSSSAYMPLMIVDREWLWYGVTASDPMICRVFAPKTIKVLLDYLRVGLIQKSAKEVAAASQMLRQSMRFRDYAANRAYCRVCQSKVSLKVSTRGKIYYKCDHCETIGGVPVSLLENYLAAIRVYCPECKKSLSAHRGRYGVYAKCTGCKKTWEISVFW